MDTPPPVGRLRTHGGFSFVSVLLAMLIAAALYFGYFGMQGSMSQRSVGIAALDASKAVACRTQRQSLERDITFWSANHPDEAPTLAALQKDGIRIPACPEGGRYEIGGSAVHCSVHR